MNSTFRGLPFLGLGAVSLLSGCLDVFVGDADECVYEGESYIDGDRFPAADGCNTCTCGPEGAVACTEIACAPRGSCQLGDATLPDGASVVCSDGCNTCSCSDGSIAQTRVGCPALPTIQVCERSDAAEALSAEVLYLDGDALALELGYGGCDQHPLRLCTDGSFLESFPVQLRVWVEDPTPQDCLAAINSQQVFDVSPVRRWYEDSYQSASGEVIMGVDGASVLYSF